MGNYHIFTDLAKSEKSFDSERAKFIVPVGVSKPGQSYASVLNGSIKSSTKPVDSKDKSCINDGIRGDVVDDPFLLTDTIVGHANDDLMTTSSTKEGVLKNDEMNKCLDSNGKTENKSHQLEPLNETMQVEHGKSSDVLETEESLSSPPGFDNPLNIKTHTSSENSSSQSNNSKGTKKINGVSLVDEFSKHIKMGEALGYDMSGCQEDLSKSSKCNWERSEKKRD
ncbi:hypothetical protein L1987_24270 [Smallanthus sonchifolius]|uniref:Uncharacterized protein n=1 Tax=Smallanthus sonchifolius TaxID=185202 RepID=A0ACB9ILF8_9ASTR|nr:hypothetical protein L1987_24270 [Smallanthus sonchifolius]